MWKKKFCRYAIFCRPIRSTIPSYHHHKPQITYQFSSLASSSSYYHGRIAEKPFSSVGGLLSRISGNFHMRENGFQLFSSRPECARNFNCWNCGAEAEYAAPFLYCDACRSVQPISDSIDYFQIFGVERTYNIEVDNLEVKYKDWQKKLHPDLVHSKSKREKEYAAEQSARVIDAYRTLADPLSRAIYIVKLEGVRVLEEETVTDPELLGEIMELREAVEEAADSQALNHIQTQLQEKLQCSSKSFEDAFRQQKYDDALASIRRMTYYRRANEEIVKKL